MWRMGLVFGWQRVVDAEPMVECIWPKTGIKVGAEEHRANGVGDSEVAALNRAILVGSISTGGSHLVVVALEQGHNLRVLVELSALI